MAVLKSVTIALSLLLALTPGHAARDRLDAEIAYDLSQKAIGRQTGDHMLTDHHGAPLRLADLRGQPLVVSLIFTSCGTVCPITTDHLREQVQNARRALGPGRFAVLTFGFDASRDTPGQLAAFAGAHRIRDIGDWHIASADPETTTAFLEELGFSFATSARGFDHVTQTTILDADGRVYRQVYGDDFPQPMLNEPLKELVLGTRTRSVAPADLWNRINFLCTVYNPRTGAYRFDYGIFFGIFFGATSLLLCGIYIFRLWRQRRRADRRMARPMKGREQFE